MALFSKIISFPALLTLAGGAGVFYNMVNKEEPVKKVKLGKYVDESKNAATYLNCINLIPEKLNLSFDSKKVEECRKQTPTASNGLNNWFGSAK